MESKVYWSVDYIKQKNAFTKLDYINKNELHFFCNKSCYWNSSTFFVGLVDNTLVPTLNEIILNVYVEMNEELENKYLPQYKRETKHNYNLSPRSLFSLAFGILQCIVSPAQDN